MFERLPESVPDLRGTAELIEWMKATPQHIWRAKLAQNLRDLMLACALQLLVKGND
ncbi:hypothetical protein NBRC116589_29940 [Ruegeria sp. HU-ET01832]